MAEEHAAKKAKPNPSVAEPLDANDPSLPTKMREALRVAQHSWLTSAQVCDILENHLKYGLRLQYVPPVKPPGGCVFLFNRRVVRFFRSDCHNWAKKADGKTVKETHEKLKIDKVEMLNCYYAHAYQDDGTPLQRRCYWLLENNDENVVLVHYLTRNSTKKQGPLPRDTSAAASDRAFHRGPTRQPSFPQLDGGSPLALKQAKSGSPKRENEAKVPGPGSISAITAPGGILELQPLAAGTQGLQGFLLDQLVQISVALATAEQRDQEYSRRLEEALAAENAGDGAVQAWTAVKKGVMAEKQSLEAKRSGLESALSGLQCYLKMYLTELNSHVEAAENRAMEAVASIETLLQNRNQDAQVISHAEGTLEQAMANKQTLEARRVEVEGILAEVAVPLQAAAMARLAALNAAPGTSKPLDASSFAALLASQLASQAATAPHLAATLPLPHFDAASRCLRSASMPLNHADPAAAAASAALRAASLSSSLDKSAFSSASQAHQQEQQKQQTLTALAALHSLGLPTMQGPASGSPPAPGVSLDAELNSHSLAALAALHANALGSEALLLQQHRGRDLQQQLDPQSLAALTGLKNGGLGQQAQQPALGIVASGRSREPSIGCLSMLSPKPPAASVAVSDPNLAALAALGLPGNLLQGLMTHLPQPVPPTTAAGPSSCSDGIYNVASHCRGLPLEACRGFSLEHSLALAALQGGKAQPVSAPPSAGLHEVSPLLQRALLGLLHNNGC